MAISLDQLPRDPAGLVQRIIDLDAEVERLNGLVSAFRALLFAPRSERHPPAGQLTLGLGVPDPTDHVPPDAPQASPAKPPRRGREARRNLGALPAHLLREEEAIEPVTTACPCCGGGLHRIGTDVRESLGVRPVAFFVRRRVFPKYACRACESAVVQAAAPPRAIEGGLAGDDLLVHVAVAKFGWHLPLHRQTQMMAAQGLHLDRSTLALWMKRLAWWLEPLYKRQLQATHAQARVFCDETPLPVLEAGRNRARRCQIWAHAMDDRAWAGPAPPAVTYVFAGSRSAGALAAQIPSFAGILQVDGYAAYKTLARRPGRSLRLAFCVAHARRKFVAAHKLTGSTFAVQVIERLAEVYIIEARIRGRSAPERRAVRQAESRPILETLKAQLVAHGSTLSRQSVVAKAIAYTLDHWDGLTRFLDDGRIEIDSNVVERAIRPITLGRKNALFAGSQGGGRTWAILASLINTAKLNQVDPAAYLGDVLARMVGGATPINRLTELLVWNWKAARTATTPAAT
jgi:transposase